MNQQEIYTVSQFVETLNQVIEYSLPFVRIEGEVTGYKVSRNKWVSFRLRDKNNTVSCFMGVWQLHTPIEDGMNVVVAGNPRLNGKYGLFSVNVQSVKPVGEGALDRAYQLLKQKLESEGLFAPERKQSIPHYPQTIGVISSSGAAGLGDFWQQVSQRWPIAQMQFEDVTVQGDNAPGEIIEALRRLNANDEIDVIAIVRGGGAKESLFAFNDETLVRDIYASNHPVVIGVGHEQDETLAQLVADVGAITPTNAAELIVPSAEVLRRELSSTGRYLASINQSLIRDISTKVMTIRRTIVSKLRTSKDELSGRSDSLAASVLQQISRLDSALALQQAMLSSTSPKKQLERGFAIVSSDEGQVSRAKDLKSKQSVTLRFDDDSRQATVQ